MSRTDILVLDGESFFALKVVRALAQARRWRIHVLAKATEAPQPCIEWSRHVSQFHRVDARDDWAYLREVERMVRRVNAKVVLPVTESGNLFCIRHREALERVAAVPALPSEEMFRTAIDKGRLAAFMAQHGVSHPRTMPGDAESFEELRFPVLVKPRRECNGHGIVKVKSLTELRAELCRRNRVNDVCVQEFVEGEDWGCSLLARDGEILAWTTQRGLRRAGQFSTFDELRIEMSAPVHAVAARLVRALKWSGVANIDLLMSPRTGEPQVLEVNGRFWASLAASILAGVNFADLAARHALGECALSGQFGERRFVHAKAWLRTIVEKRNVRRLRSDILSVVSDPFPEAMSRLRPRFGANRRTAAASGHPLAAAVI